MIYIYSCMFTISDMFIMVSETERHTTKMYDNKKWTNKYARYLRNI